jgi:hypothetical protein
LGTASRCLFQSAKVLPFLKSWMSGHTVVSMLTRFSLKQREDRAFGCDQVQIIPNPQIRAFFIILENHSSFDSSDAI